jgi:hypothetical protein
MFSRRVCSQVLFASRHRARVDIGRFEFACADSLPKQHQISNIAAYKKVQPMLPSKYQMFCFNKEITWQAKE